MDLCEKACFDVSDFLFGGVLMRCFWVGFIYNNGVYRWFAFRVLSVILYWFFCELGGRNIIFCIEKQCGEILVFWVNGSLLSQKCHSKCAKLHRKRF